MNNFEQTVALSAEQIQIAEKDTEKFVQLYYTYYDKDRGALEQFYRKDSTIVWNGNPAKGIEEYSRLLAKIPASQHKPIVIDCQPVAAPPLCEVILLDIGTVKYGILVNVAGTVKYGSNPQTPTFSHSFLLAPTKEGYYILNEDFRIVSP